MPVQTVERVRAAEVVLKQRMVEKAAGLEGVALRRLKKKLRRTARKRRRLAVAQDRRDAAKKKSEAPAEA